MLTKRLAERGFACVLFFFVMLIIAGPASAAISLVSIDTGTPGSLDEVTITPDEDGSDDRAFIHFTSSVSGNFRVVVDTNGTGGFQIPDWADPTSWETADTTMDGWIGTGESREFMFEGRDNMWRVLPNGTYAISIFVDEDDDWNTIESTDDSLSVIIQTASISGTITSDGTPLEGVMVNAGSQYGWGQGVTASDGTYTVSGLKEGTYHLDAQLTGYVNANYPSDVSVTAGADTSGIDLTMSPSVQITGTITIPTSFESFVNMWGGTEDQLWININGNSDDFSAWVWGNAHIHATDSYVCTNATADDDNDGVTDTNECSTTVTYSLDVNPPESGTKDYRIRAEAEGYASAEYTVTVDSSGGTQNIAMTKASRVYGTITLPAVNATGTPIWVDVNGRTSTGTMVWGGGSVDNGQTTGNFDIRSALAGTYAVEVRVWGYKTTTVSDVVVTAGTDTDLGELVISQGGAISGTITISGDTSNYEMFENDPGTGAISLWVDAWSPTSNGWSGTQVQIDRGTDQSAAYSIGGLDAGTYEVHAWLGEGYEQTPMPLTATLSSSSDTVTDVDMLFAPYQGQVSGTISGSGVDMSLVVIKAIKAGWDWQAPVLVQPDGTGAYTLTGLGTSEYILEVNEYANAVAVMGSGARPRPSGNFGTETLRVPVMNGSATSGQDIALSEGASISGTVCIESGYAGSVDFAVDMDGEVVSAFPMKLMMMGGASMYGAPLQSYNAGTGCWSYTIPGLGAGAYNVKPPTELIDHTSGFDENAQMMQNMYTPDLAGERQIVAVSSGEEKAGVNFTLSDGYSVGGTITLPEIPSGDDWNFVCELEVRHPQRAGMGRHQPVFVGDFDGTKTYSYTLDHVPNGSYVVQAWTPNYVPGYKNITVNGSDVAGANLELKTGASISGKLVDSDTGEAIDPNDGVRVRCEAWPWVEGSWRETRQDPWSNSKFTQTNGKYTGDFTLSNLPAGSYVVTVEAEHGKKQSGAKNYVGIRKAGVVVPDTAGAAVDIGTLQLKEGVTITGTITDSDSHPIGNIEVEAEPVDEKDGASSAWATTDSNGKYTIYGIDPDVKYYYVLGGSRPDFMDFAPIVWGEVEKDVEVASTGLADLDFVLPAANATLSGTITKSGSSGWELPFSDDSLPAPFILLQRQGGIYTDPMDGIEAIGEPSSTDTTTFSVDGIVPGTYTLKVFCLGYTTKIIRDIVIAEGSNVLSSEVQLVEGGTASGTVVKANGTQPTTGEISEVAAVSADLDVLIFGRLTTNSASREVTGYSVTGLEAGKSYNLVFVNDSDGGPESIFVMSDPIEAGDTYNAVIAESAPIITARAIKNGDGSFTIGIFSTSYLNDAAGSDVLTVSQGNGALTTTLSPDKMQVEGTYTPHADDTLFTLAFSAHYGTSNSLVTDSFSYDVNADAWNEGSVNTLMGGAVGLGQGDKCKVFMEPGDITEGDSDGSTTVTIQKDSSSVSGSGVQTNTARTESLLAQATPDLPSYATASSGLYDIALPSGDSITSGQTITVSFPYDSSLTDTSDLHIYHYIGGEWVAESTSVNINRVNKTITADVTSLSPFQVAVGSSSSSSSSSSSTSTPAAAGSSGGGGGCRLATGPVTLQQGLTEMVMMLLPLFFLMLLRLKRRMQD